MFLNLLGSFFLGKAANAGGAAVRTEMCQNSQHICWCADEVDCKPGHYENIHQQCITYGKEKGQINYVKGANIAGFIRVADAMLAQGII